eukprot:XP_011663780.1 PREDICTED: uncharacterized protein LOC105438103 [Strongylocentrotus purpuratus]
MITVPVQLHTTGKLPCGCPVSQESTISVQWYESSNSDVFVKDGEALAWWYEGDTGSSQGFGIKDDFSMVMYSVNVTNGGLYRCIVTPVDSRIRCTHDVKLIIFANPDTSPVIEYNRQTNGFNVTCSISNVFPMTFPILTTKEGNRTAFINSDGTYNTTVTNWFAANETDITIACLYSNLNFTIMSSLRIIDSDSINQNTTHTDLVLWMVWIIPIIGVLFFVVIVYAIKTALRKTIRNNTEDID